MNGAQYNFHRNRKIFFGILIIWILSFANGFYKEYLYKLSPILFWLHDIAHFVVIPLAVLIYLYFHYNLKPSDYGLIKPHKGYTLAEMCGASIFTAVIAGAAYELSNTLVTIVLHNGFGYVAPVFHYSSTIPTGMLRIPVVIYLAATAGVVEEIIFRGISYKLIYDIEGLKHKKQLYIYSTSLLFSVIHFEDGYPSLISAFVFGYIAARFYLLYRNLWPLIGAHFLIDLYIFW